VDLYDQSIEFATLTRRTIALLVDTLGAIVLCISSIVFTEIGLHGDTDVGTRFYWLTYLLIWFFFLIEVFSSRSCGKWLSGIRIASRSGVVGIGQRFVRSLLKLLWAHLITILWGLFDAPHYDRGIYMPPRLGMVLMVLICSSIFVGALSSISIVFSARKLAFHDMLARTQVIRVRKTVRGFSVVPKVEEHGHQNTAAHATQRAA
jgi:uncharacterized RDD family membrane protein YckC